MLKVYTLHVLLAVRPHAGGVLGRRPNASRIQAGRYIRPSISKCCFTDAKGQIKASYITESGLANVLTVALSLAILLCDTLPSPARTIEASSTSQRDALYERRDTRSSATRSITEDVNAVSRLTSEAEFAIKDGNMHQALQKYTTIVKEYSDLALAERARIKRALMLYETGAVEQALLELEDEEVALRGNAEVHAALAALLYAEKPLERQRAEQQWEVCCEFDNRYSNVEWVASNKTWGPRLLQSLQKFLRLE